SIQSAHAHELAGAPQEAKSRLDDAVNMSMFQGFYGPFLDCRRFIIQSAFDEGREASGGHDTDRFREKYLRRLRRLLRRASARHGDSTILIATELLTLRH